MKKVLAILFLFSGLTIRASEPFSDSLHTSFRANQLAVPAMLTATGALGFGGWWKNTINIPVRDYTATLRDGRYLYADDFIQYLPVAASLFLCLDRRFRESWQDRMLLAGTAFILEAAVVHGLKNLVTELRPDGSSRNSFPSGHTATAFMGAELVRLEYGRLWGTLAYFTAAFTGLLRIYNDKHWCNDILAGAGIGILCARAAYWMLPYERRVLGRFTVLPGLTALPDRSAAPVLSLNYSF